MLTQQSGQKAEGEALLYLQKQGFKLITKNYNCRFGEIDLIMQDGEHLVFIEVRSRINTSYGDGAASITDAKRQKIIKSTTHFLLAKQLLDKHPIRFDVISIDGKSGAISWLKDAFDSDY